MTDTTLERLADTLWVSAAPLAMLGVQVGTRMTLVRLSDRSLWLHSPVAISATQPACNASAAAICSR